MGLGRAQEHGQLDWGEGSKRGSLGHKHLLMKLASLWWLGLFPTGLDQDLGRHEKGIGASSTWGGLHQPMCGFWCLRVLDFWRHYSTFSCLLVWGQQPPDLVRDLTLWNKDIFLRSLFTNIDKIFSGLWNRIFLAGFTVRLSLILTSHSLVHR